MYGRREFLQTLGALPFAMSAQTPRRHPNIIFILTDDQGYADLACHGNPVIKTPNIDLLHSESVRFTDFHVSPTCSPTRSSLMSGKHELKNGISHTINERERMSLKTTTIAQVLKSAGYTTGIFGKWHLGDAAPYQPGQRGFDEVYIHGCGGIGQRYPGTCSDAPGNKYFNPEILHNNVFEKTNGYCTDVFFSQAAKWIGEKRKASAPFFAYITPNAPHAPLDVPEYYENLYKTANIPEPSKKFFGMLTNIDDNVGRLLSKVKEWGLERDTLVIYMNDNGGTAGVRVFNAGMRGQKGTPYMGGTRAASFFRWTGTLKPADVKPMAAHIDIYPTLAELAGAKIPPTVKLDGRSLVPLLKNPNAPWQDRFLFTHVARWDKGKAAQSKFEKCRVRNGRFSMVNMGKGWELYDLQNDPGETTDVKDKFPAEAKKLSDAYDKFWDEAYPLLENEDAVPPTVPPYIELYQKQYGGKV